MRGHESGNKRMKEGRSCYLDGAWWCSGPGTCTSSWDVTECLPVWILCICTLRCLNKCQHHPRFRHMMPTTSHDPLWTAKDIQHLKFIESNVVIFLRCHHRATDRNYSKLTQFLLFTGTWSICDIVSKRYSVI